MKTFTYFSINSNEQWFTFSQKYLSNDDSKEDRKFEERNDLVETELIKIEI